MSRVWLCEDRIAERPLVVNAGIGLYSFEELCYYLYQNAESVEESFFNDMLCQWLAQELGKQELSEKISTGLAQEKSGCWCMEQILADGGFYSQAEIDQVLQAVQSMENKNPAQRAKLRGDRLLRSGKFRSALLEYRKALKQEGDLFLQGQIWHNMGTVYARQFLFAPAAECYKKAYEMGQRTESSEAYLLALACRDGQVPETEQSKMKKLLDELLEIKRSGNRTAYDKKIEELLVQLRIEYRKSE